MKREIIENSPLAHSRRRDNQHIRTIDSCFHDLLLTTAKGGFLEHWTPKMVDSFQHAFSLTLAHRKSIDKILERVGV